ncbi:MAG: hypothetical protein WCO52_06275 [bacterium]
MGVIYASTVRTSRMNAVETALDAGAGAAYLEIGDAGFATVLVTFTLSDPAGTVSGDVLTGNSMPKSATAGNSGTAAGARLKDSTGTVVASGLTVGTVGTNVIISPSTTITSGQSCSLTALTLTHNTSGV